MNGLTQMRIVFSIALSMLLLTLVWAVQVHLQRMHAYTPAGRWLTMGSLVVTVAMLTLLFMSVLKPCPPTPLRHTHDTRDAYLVVHLSLDQHPPVAIFACIYSCSARELTMTGANEARLDLYKVTAPTFQEALDDMERVYPLYFPWVVPLMRRTVRDLQ